MAAADALVISDSARTAKSSLIVEVGLWRMLEFSVVSGWRGFDILFVLQEEFIGKRCEEKYGSTLVVLPYLWNSYS